MPNLFPGGNELMDAAKILKRLDLKEKMQVADLGCGRTGHFLIPACHLVGNKGEGYAVDILKPVLLELEGRAKMMGIKNLKTVWADLEMYESVNIPEGSLDAAFLINILFQTKERANVIKEALRLMKKEGQLLLIDWAETSSPLGPPLPLRVGEAEIRQLVQGHDLKMKEEFKAGPYHYGFIFVKE